jgi:phosphoribosylformylglycinamidine cyclo-ligase
MRPTRLYVGAAKRLAEAGAHALAHITGGGLVENLPRVLPRGLAARIDLDSYALPPLFTWLAEAGGLDRRTLARTFNMGVGLVGIVPAEAADAAVAALTATGETAWILGRLETCDDPPVVMLDGGRSWPRA